MKEEIKEALEAAIEEIDWALNPYKDQSTKAVYLHNTKRYIVESKEKLLSTVDRIEQLEKALEMAMPIVEHNSPTLTRIINHTLGKEE